MAEQSRAMHLEVSLERIDKIDGKGKLEGGAGFCFLGGDKDPPASVYPANMLAEQQTGNVAPT